MVQSLQCVYISTLAVCKNLHLYLFAYFVRFKLSADDSVLTNKLKTVGSFIIAVHTLIYWGDNKWFIHSADEKQKLGPDFPTHRILLC